MVSLDKMLLNMQGIIFVALIISSVNCHLKDKTKKIYIGSALNPRHLDSDQTYKTMAAQEFNCLTPENSMKWSSIETTKGHRDYSKAEQLVAFGEQHGMKIRGHTLVWHQQIPTWVQALNKKAELEDAMKKHITEEMTHFKGKIYAWDVLNEIFNDDGSYRDSLYHKTLGTGFVAEALRTAHSADPNAKLYINDYSIEGKNSKSDALFSLVKSLKAQGVPLHGIGMQCHRIVGTVPHDLQSNMQRFADLGLDVAITELDIRMNTPSDEKRLNQQALDYAKVYSSCLAVDRCVGVSVWGFTDKYSWVPTTFPGMGAAHIWDSNFKPKPALEAIEKVLH